MPAQIKPIQYALRVPYGARELSKLLTKLQVCLETNIQHHPRIYKFIHKFTRLKTDG